ncbi:MAG: alpha/beta hydrolase, partial [Streptomycetaceae bacterium]|nr:alpha/beta hydrolase [Streptomycetaceae bacterium]
ASGRDFVDLGDGVTLSAPGLALEAYVVPAHPAADESVRGAAPDAWQVAAMASGFTTERSLAVTVAETPQNPGAEALTLAVPPPAAGTTQVLRYQDAAGLWHWKLPEPRPDEAESTRFAVPRAALDTAAPADRPAQPALDEGLIGTIVRKVVHQLMVYAYPVVDRLLDPLVDNLAQQREVTTHPYRVRTFTRDNYTRPADSAVETAEQWGQLAGGRVLLLIHGTFSTSHGGFGGLDADTVDALNRAYEGRVIAFDHPTVSVSLAANIDALHKLTRAPGPLDVDILAHSRGGLVARELIRRQSAPTRSTGCGAWCSPRRPTAAPRSPTPRTSSNSSTATPTCSHSCPAPPRWSATPSQG